MAEHTRPNAETRGEEAREARMSADPGREPTEEEAQAAESNAVDPEAAEHEAEMNRRGAEQQGEGRLP